MIDNVNSVFDTAQDILDEISSIYSSVTGVTALPTKQYIAAGGQGSQPHDCEQVTISMEQLYVGMPGAPAQGPERCDSPRSAVFFVEIVRNTTITERTARGVTVPKMRTAAQETDLARIQMQDALLLMEAGLNVASEFIGGVADVSAGPESGGYQAMVLTLILPVV